MFGCTIAVALAVVAWVYVSPVAAVALVIPAAGCFVVAMRQILAFGRYRRSLGLPAGLRELVMSRRSRRRVLAQRSQGRR